MSAILMSLRPTVTEQEIHQAMRAIADEMIADNQDAPTVVAALNTPVAPAALFADLCAMLGVAPPAFVRWATG